MAKTEIATIDTPAPVAVRSLKDGYSSIKGDDLDTRKRVFTAVSNAENISDHLGVTFNVVDVIVQPVSSENEETGEIEEYERTVLMTADGGAFAASSSGILTALGNLLTIVGEPSGWPDGGIALQVVEKKSRKNGYRFMTFELV